MTHTRISHHPDPGQAVHPVVLESGATTPVDMMLSAKLCMLPLLTPFIAPGNGREVVRFPYSIPERASITGHEAVSGIITYSIEKHEDENESIRNVEDIMAAMNVMFANLFSWGEAEGYVNEPVERRSCSPLLTMQGARLPVCDLPIAGCGFVEITVNCLICVEDEGGMSRVTVPLPVSGLANEIWLFDTRVWSIEHAIKTASTWTTTIEFIGSGRTGAESAERKKHEGEDTENENDEAKNVETESTGNGQNTTAYSRGRKTLLASGNSPRKLVFHPLPGSEREEEFTLIPVSGWTTSQDVMQIITGAVFYSVALYQGSDNGAAPVTGGTQVTGRSDGINSRYWARDSDMDGMVDELDAFPDDITRAEDTYGDGAGDNPSGNCPDTFPFDPAASMNTDGHGHPDRWNPGYSREDSPTGLILDWTGP